MAACTASTAGTASGTSARLLIVMLFDHIKTISGDDGHHNNIC